MLFWASKRRRSYIAGEVGWPPLCITPFVPTRLFIHVESSRAWVVAKKPSNLLIKGRMRLGGLFFLNVSNGEQVSKIFALWFAIIIASTGTLEPRTFTNSLNAFFPAGLSTVLEKESWFFCKGGFWSWYSRRKYNLLLDTSSFPLCLIYVEDHSST